MANQVRNSAGQVVTIENDDRITSINGDACEYYVSDVQQKSAASAYPFLRKWPFTLQSTALNSDGSISSGALQALAGQVKIYSAKDIEKQDPNSPKSKGYILAHAANQNQSARLIKIFFADQMAAQAYPGAFIVQMVTVTWTGGDEDAGEPGTGSEVTTTIQYKSLDLEQQTQHDIHSELAGTACLQVSLGDVTLAQIEAAHHFVIQRKGGSSAKYTLVNGGIKHLPSNHVELSLVKQQ